MSETMMRNFQEGTSEISGDHPARNRAHWIPGAVSATFKKIPMDQDQIISLLTDCGLQAVEWSENLHVFPEKTEQAAELRKKTEGAGLQVAAYGSYYRLGEQRDQGETFRKSLRSALALGADIIRIWAGGAASADVSEEDRRSLTAEAALAARIAGDAGVRVALEWHKNTLTDTTESAARLMQEAGEENLYCLWQPTVALSPRERTEGIRRMGNRLLNFHVYSWPDGKRGPLNAAEWQYYFDAAAGLGGTRYALLEFVRDDSVEQFARDAAELLKLTETF